MLYFLLIYYFAMTNRFPSHLEAYIFAYNLLYTLPTAVYHILHCVYPKILSERYPLSVTFV